MPSTAADWLQDSQPPANAPKTAADWLGVAKSPALNPAAGFADVMRKAGGGDIPAGADPNYQPPSWGEIFGKSIPNIGSFTVGNIAGQAGATALGAPAPVAKGAGALTGAVAGTASDYLTDHISSWFRGKGAPEEHIPTLVEDFKRNLLNAGVSLGAEGAVAGGQKFMDYATGKGALRTGAEEAYKEGVTIQSEGIAKEQAAQEKQLGKQEEKAGQVQREFKDTEESAQREANRKLQEEGAAKETERQAHEQEKLKGTVASAQATSGKIAADKEQEQAQHLADQRDKLEKKYSADVEKQTLQRELKPHVDEVDLAKGSPLVQKPIRDSEGKPVLDEQGKAKVAFVAGDKPIQLRRSVKEIVHDAAQPQKDYFHGEYERQLKGKEDIQVPTLELNGEPNRIREQLIADGQTASLSPKVNRLFDKVGSALTAEPSTAKRTPELIAEVERSMNLEPGESQNPLYRESFEEEMHARIGLAEMTAPIRTLLGLRSEVQALSRGKLEPVDRRALGMLTAKIHETLDPHLPPNSTLSGEYAEFMKQFGPDVQYGKHFDSPDQTGPMAAKFFDHGASSMQRVNMLFDNAKPADRPVLNTIAAEHLTNNVADLKKNRQFYTNLLEKMYGKGHPLANPGHFLYQEKATRDFGDLFQSHTPAGEKLRAEYKAIGDEAMETYGKRELAALKPVMKQMEPYFQADLEARLTKAKTTREKVDAARQFFGQPTLEQQALDIQKKLFPDPQRVGMQARAGAQPGMDEQTAMRALKQMENLGPLGQQTAQQMRSMLQRGQVDNAATLARNFLADPALPQQAKAELQKTLRPVAEGGTEALQKAFPEMPLVKDAPGVPVQQRQIGTVPEAKTPEDVMTRSVQLGLGKGAGRSWQAAYAERVLPISVVMGAAQVGMGAPLSAWHAGMLVAGGGAKGINVIRSAQLRALQDPAKARAFVKAMSNYSAPNNLTSLLRMSFFSGMADILQRMNEQGHPTAPPAVQSKGPLVPHTPRDDRRSEAEKLSTEALTQSGVNISGGLRDGRLTSEDTRALLKHMGAA